MFKILCVCVYMCVRGDIISVNLGLTLSVPNNAAKVIRTEPSDMCTKIFQK